MAASALSLGVIAAQVATAEETVFNCTLEETCTAEANCEGVLSIGFGDIQSDRLHTNFGDFEVEIKAKAGTKLDEVKLASGEYTITSSSNMIRTLSKSDGRSLALTLAQEDAETVYATLMTIPAKYADYNNAQRVFAGPCELEF
ncbi:hypothetical protein [Shimia sp.]|uniref:hypothetical protein n=1 Tax=Shimia sp. TaxID=1954381 RepID=UPI003B8CF4D5